MRKIHIKFLSGEIVSLDTEFKNICDISLQLNTLDMIKFPLRRTILIEDNEDKNIYNVYIESNMSLFIFNSIDNMNVYYTSNLGNIENGGIDDKYDKTVHMISNFRGDTIFYVKFPMPSYTIYRVYVLSSNKLDIIYMYDTNDRSDTFSKARSNTYTNENIVIIIDCNGEVLFLSNHFIEKTDNLVSNIY